MGTVKKPATPPLRIRRNIKSLKIDDPIVVGYGNAVEAMQRLPIDNPLSWRYQAAIHDYPFPDVDPAKAGDKKASFDLRRINPADPESIGRGDPMADLGDNLPADRGTFWRQCQHNCWFFLPWHRMYLHHFEKIVADQVKSLGGPEDWALPYWDWTANDGDGKIPEALRSPTINGKKNFLFVLERSRLTGRNANAGDRIATARKMDKSFACLVPTVFEGSSQFGGGAARLHSGEGPPEPTGIGGLGLLEGTPHGSMHTSTGGPGGWMSSFTQAALDPIFWMHHCNIDRLWEVWIQRKNPKQAPGKSDQNPAKSAWLKEKFRFHAAGGGNGDLTPADVVQTRKAPLLYEYDDTSDPRGGK
jgi:tyrosinase